MPRALSTTVLINILVLVSGIALVEVGSSMIIQLEKFFTPISTSDRTRQLDSDIIPTNWQQVFHPGVGHSHQEKEFQANQNTKGLNYDNLSATEIFPSTMGRGRELNILVLGGSTTDPLGTHFSGKRGTWVHHLFDGLATNSDTQFKVRNAGNGGDTSSNELLRLITSMHSNSYDFIISYNGLNEIYFSDSRWYYNPENILASKMLLESMHSAGIIRSFDGRSFATIRGHIWDLLNSTKTSSLIRGMRQKLSKFRARNAAFSMRAVLTPGEIKYIKMAATTWNKNTHFMNALAETNNSRYLVILQPTLGLSKQYCKSSSTDCLLADNPLYVEKMRRLYTYLRRYCKEKNYCYDISSDEPLGSDDLLYTDASHPNSDGNKRVAKLIAERISQALIK